MKRKIYAASSWRNDHYYEVIFHLANAGHEVFNFRRPCAGSKGFHWHEIDTNWKNWTPETYRRQVFHAPIANRGFTADLNGMKWADTCVLILPCGRSAHLEAGWFIGQGKPTFIYLHPEGFEPELMYRLVGDEDHVSTSLDHLVTQLGRNDPTP